MPIKMPFGMDAAPGTYSHPVRNSPQSSSASSGHGSEPSDLQRGGSSNRHSYSANSFIPDQSLQTVSVRSQAFSSLSTLSRSLTPESHDEESSDYDHGHHRQYRQPLDDAISIDQKLGVRRRVKLETADCVQ